MPLSEMVRLDVITVERSATVEAAAKKLHGSNVGSVVILEDGAPAGILTDRDMAIKVVGEGRDPTTTLVEDVMSSPVHTVDEDDGIFGAIDTMTEHGVRRMPVVDAEGQLKGLIALDDILTLLVTEFTLLEGVLMAQTRVGQTQAEPKF